MRKRQEGFSLIELLIVVAIILIIAAIAIPNLLRAKIAANEASAVASLRTYNTACITYDSTYGSYPTSLSNLGPITAPATPTSTTADLVDSVLGVASPTKSGYAFSFTNGTPTGGYNITAAPESSATGTRYFYTDMTGVIHYNVGAAATASNSPIGGN